MNNLEEIEKVIHQIFDREKEFRDAMEAQPIAEHHYKVKRATEYLRADGTIKDKEATADRSCEKEFLARLQAEARASIAKEYLNDARSVLSALQTIYRNQS